ncbi:MAG: hypothetical protein ABR954_07690 [Dehalococcoidales bacterium]
MKQVHLRELTTRFITRANGARAFNNLVPFKAATVIIDLSNVPILTYPFLDEMIRLALKYNQLKHIIFRVDDELTLDKLSYIAGTRSVDIAVSSSNHKKHRIQPKAFTRQRAIVVDAKEKLDKD